MKFERLIYVGLFGYFLHESVYGMMGRSLVRPTVQPKYKEYTNSSSPDYIQPKISSSIVRPSQKNQYDSIMADSFSQPIEDQSVHKSDSSGNQGGSVPTQTPQTNSWLYNTVFGGMKFKPSEKSQSLVADTSQSQVVKSNSIQSQPSQHQNVSEGLQVSQPNVVSSVVKNPSFLNDIKAAQQLKKTSSVAVQQPQEKNSYTQQEYFVQRTKVQDSAEQQVLKSLQREVDVEFQEKWPDVLQAYASQRAGQNIPQSRVNALQVKTKDQMLKAAVAKNKAVIDQKIAQALQEFESNAVVVKPKMPGSKSVGVRQSSESSVRIDAENAVRKAIEQKVNQSFVEQESIMLEDYGLDHPNASQPEIIAAVQKEMAPLKNQRYLDALVENKAAIKQAGQDAVVAWNALQIKSSRSASPVGVNAIL